MDGESVPDTPVTDTINNVEAVQLYAPVPGEYVVRVRASRLVADALKATPGVVDQDFALVISAAVAAPGVGVLSFDRPVYTAPSVIRISLVDYDLAGQPAVPVLLRSSTETNGETITLSPSGSTGIFTASVATVTGPPLPDGKLQVRHDDLIEAVYQDASPASPRNCTARADLRAPVISNVAATNQFGDVLISWDTDEEANSFVLYGTNTLNLVASSPIQDTTHELSLTNLVVGQAYRFLVISEDEAGNWTTNDNGGLYFTFVPQQPPGILLVNSFGDWVDPIWGLLLSAPPLSGYTDALDQLGQPYDVFDATADATPTLNQLRSYRSVIWRVSDLFPPSPALVQNITNYLNSGGSLLIASMEAVTRFTEGGFAAFNTNVLQVKSYTEDQPVLSLTGSPGDPVGSGINIAELDYSPYQEMLDLFGVDTPSDWITPTSKGTPSILSDGQTVGIRSPKPGVDLPWRVVFPFVPVGQRPPGRRHRQQPRRAAPECSQFPDPLDRRQLHRSGQRRLFVAGPGGGGS